MKTSIKRSPWTLFLYFVLAVAFSLCAAIAGWTTILNFYPPGGGYAMQTNLQWMFWLFLILAVFCLMPVFAAALKTLEARHVLPRFVGNLFGKKSESDGLFEGLRSRSRSLGGRLVAAGFAIFGTIFILSKSNAVREMDVDSYVYEYLGGRLGTHSHWPVNPQPLTAALKVSQHGLDDSVYLRDCLKIVGDLKSVGARAVMVDIRGIGGIIKNYETLRAIEETGISVFGMSDWSIRYVDFGQLNTKDPRGELRVSKGAMTMKSSEVSQDPFLYRFKPELDGVNDVQVLDVTLELLRKYHNYPREMEATKSGDNIVFGDYRIPLGRDGYTYARQSILAWWNPILTATRDSEGDTLKYRGWIKSTNKWSVANIQDLKDTFSGKIVFLDRSDLESLDNGWMLITSYRSAIQTMSEGSLVARSHTLPVWVTLVCIALAGLAAFKLRALPSMLTIFGVGCIVLIGCWLLYYRLNIMIDIFYPMLAVGMSMFIFPSITLMEKMGDGE